MAGTLGNNQLYARFEINGLPQEAGLTTGDSGGPWFAPDGQGLLRLVGISFGATGPYAYDVAGAPGGTVFEAALVDLGGLWLGTPGNQVFIPENPVNVPSALVASRISDRIGWISTVVDLSTEDTDRDGVANQFDNCPFLANANQADNGGLGFSTTPDGIGNACQCGDVTGEGQVNDTDAAFIKRQALGLSAPLFLVPQQLRRVGRWSLQRDRCDADPPRGGGQYQPPLRTELSEREAVTMRAGSKGLGEHDSIPRADSSCSSRSSPRRRSAREPGGHVSRSTSRRSESARSARSPVRSRTP